jgi:hypothetical protein
MLIILNKCLLSRFSSRTRRNIIEISHCVLLLSGSSDGYRRRIDWILDLRTQLYTQLGTTSNCSIIANLHTLEITVTLAKPFPACSVLTSRSVATAFSSGDSSASSSQLLSSQPPVQNSTLNRLSDWRPSHTNLLVFTS